MNKPQIAFKLTLTEKYEIHTTSILSRWSIFDAPYLLVVMHRYGMKEDKSMVEISHLVPDFLAVCDLKLLPDRHDPIK